jgi:hypothetical protein
MRNLPHRLRRGEGGWFGPGLKAATSKGLGCRRRRISDQQNRSCGIGQGCQWQDYRRLRQGGPWPKNFQHNAALALIKHRPKYPVCPQSLRHFCGQSFPRGHPNQGLAERLRQAFRQRNGGAQPGKSARPDANRNGVQRRRRNPRFRQDLLGHGRQGRRLAARCIMQGRGQHGAVPQKRCGTPRERTFKGENQHVSNLRARRFMRASWQDVPLISRSRPMAQN